MKRFLAPFFAALALLSQPVLASADKPLVIISGQTRQLPAGDTLQVNASASGGASINIPHGTAPSAPVNGDCWTTTSGMFCRINGSTIGPFNSVSGGGGLLASNNLSDVANAGTSRTNLGLAIGTNVQAYDADLTTYAGITPSANVQSLLGAADYAAVRSALSLGTFATQNYATPPAIGGGTPAAGSFTTLSANSTLTTAITGSTQCLHVDSAGVVSGSGSDCGAAAGTVTTTGSPASGNLAKFSGAATITSGDLSGDVTTSGTSATTIASDAVTYAKIQNISAASKLLGRGSAGGSGDTQEITLGTNLAMSGTTLNASSGAGTGSAAWSIIDTTGAIVTGQHSWTFSTNVATVDFVGLASYTDIKLIARGITLSVSGVLAVEVSTDNGSTWFTSSGNYLAVYPAGTEGNFARFNLTTVNATAARSGIIVIEGINTSGDVKYAHVNSDTSSSQSYNLVFAGSTAPITAIRFKGANGGNITAGTIDVTAR
jgi:hypothetical protein